ncbi:MAG: uroporphyrinogen decarboxylase, partial [Gammaproteobacteria bacterium]|nr:uroporphyrinogen decarboxylase [Gammaproteobacteria bacterium]
MFPPLVNDRLVKTLKREPVDRTPVWMMRQAGRYLPEYRATRAQAGNFMALCQTPELACEVTLQPLRRYAFDAAILFSDILTIPDAMGLGLHFVEGEGPCFERPLSRPAEVKQLPVDVMQELGYVFDAVALIRRELNGQVPLIGFTGSPWTLATYMVEGQSTREFKKIKSMLYQQPQVLHELLGKLANVVTDYLVAQVKAGAQVLQIFDTWGGVLSHSAYEDFSLQYMQLIIAGLQQQLPVEQQVPLVLFTKGGAPWLEQIAASGCDAIGLDWSVNIGTVRGQLADRVVLQGNMDPAVLRAAPAVIDAEVQRILASYGSQHGKSGHIFNLGHGITPDIDPACVEAFV